MVETGWLDACGYVGIDTGPCGWAKLPEGQTLELRGYIETDVGVDFDPSFSIRQQLLSYL